MATLRAILLLGLASFVFRANAVQFDAFLQVTPHLGTAPTGTSTDPIYSGWIDVLGFEGGIQNAMAIPAPFPPPHTQIQQITLVKKADETTGKLFQYVASGALIDTVKLVLAVRGPVRTEMWKMTASTCLFTKQSFSADAGESDLEEHLTFVTGKIEWSYTEIAASGDPIAELYANWDVINDIGLGGTRPSTRVGGVDSDGDGIPDDWEVYYGLDPHTADADSDYDGDGLTALEEYIAHTDPNVPQSTFKVTGLQPGPGGTLMLSWQSMVGLNYRVLSAPGPDGPYTVLKSVSSAGTGTTTTSVPFGGAQLFFKVVTP